MAEVETTGLAGSDSEVFEVDWDSVTTAVFDDVLSNIVHDVVRDVHRSEKLLRMSSAVTQISIAAQNNLQSPHPTDTPTKANGSFQMSQASRSGKLETSYATYNDGVICLKGNPLQTTTQIFCSQCRLPRLLFPLVGAGSQLPDDLNATYCTKHPFVYKPGHDMYGTPFPSDQAKTKKERELARRQEKDSTPASQGSDMNGLTQEEQIQAGIAKLMPQGKGAGYIPWQTCPKCKRSLLITRFAQHLEKCLGISGRQSSRNAMAKLSGQNGSSTGTPMGSRPGTPGPAGSVAGSDTKGNRRDRDDDDADELDDVPLKRMKKRPYLKKGDRDRGGTQTSIDASSQGDEKEIKPGKLGRKDSDAPKIVLKMKSSGGGSPTKSDTNLKKSSSAISDAKTAGVKRERERDKDDDNATPKKKTKLGVNGVSGNSVKKES